MFPLAASRLETTPSITSLILLTLSSSFRRAASRACSASYFDSPLRCGGILVFSDLGLDFCFGLEAREGEAKRSSVSESERSSFPISGVAILFTIERLIDEAEN